MNKHEAAAQIMDDAYAQIERGWVQGRESEGDRVCFSRALRIAGQRVNIKPGEVEAFRLIEAHLPRGTSVIEFNDATGRKKEEILQVLKACANIEREYTY